MSVNRKRGGASKSCTCRQCGVVFLARKLQPFCSASCKHAHPATTQPQAILEGAKTNDTSTTNHS